MPEPTSRLRTFASIERHAEERVLTFVDAATPDGHFLALTTIVGGSVTYLLRGTEGDTSAPIVGRIEAPAAGRMDQGPLHYVGGGIKGGTLFLHHGLSGEAFARMVAMAAQNAARAAQD
jgi:hypothetical protein